MQIFKAFVFLISLCLFGGEARSAASLPPNLNVTVSGPAQVEAGKDIVYEVTVDNSGEDSASNTILTILNPAAGSFVSVDASGFTCSSSDNFAPGEKTVCGLGIVTPNTPIKILFTWLAPEVQTTLALAAQVTGDGDDQSQTADNEAETTTQVVVPPADDPGDDNNGGCALNPSPGVHGAATASLLLLAFLPLALALRARSRT